MLILFTLTQLITYVNTIHIRVPVFVLFPRARARAISCA
jgi:hypothetical protein